MKRWRYSSTSVCGFVVVQQTGLSSYDFVENGNLHHGLVGIDAVLVFGIWDQRVGLEAGCNDQCLWVTFISTARKLLMEYLKIGDEHFPTCFRIFYNILFHSATLKTNQRRFYCNCQQMTLLISWNYNSSNIASSLHNLSWKAQKGI